MFGKRFSRALALTTTAMLIMTTAVFADTLTVDGDTATAGAGNSHFTLCEGAGASVTVGIELKYNGSQHFNPGTVNVTASGAPSFITAASGTLSVPSNWGNGAGNVGTVSTTLNLAVASNWKAASATEPAPWKVTYTLTQVGTSYTVTSDNNVQITEQTTGCTAANAAPLITSAAFTSATVNCRVANSLDVSFTDADSTSWSALIDWDYDGTTFDNDTSLASVTSPFSESHTYNTPGTYTAALKVTDNQGLTSAVATATVTVAQTYTIDFLPPFDDSTPSGLIVNKMKNGRVVPVKATLYDDCALAAVTDPSTSVTIKISKTSGTGTGDPIEQYADAGESSAGTSAFRFSDSFWIYNLDSKALGLVVNNLYRIDVYVGAVQATVANWAVLQPVK